MAFQLLLNFGTQEIHQPLSVIRNAIKQLLRSEVPHPLQYIYYNKSIPLSDIRELHICIVITEYCCSEKIIIEGFSFI